MLVAVDVSRNSQYSILEGIAIIFYLKQYCRTMILLNVHKKLYYQYDCKNRIYINRTGLNLLRGYKFAKFVLKTRICMIYTLLFLLVDKVKEQVNEME